MKKSAIFAAFALCLGFVSCDNVEMPNPPAQANPQDPAFSAGDIELVADPVTEGSIDLTEYNNAGLNIPVAEISKLDNVPSGFEVQFVAKFSKSDDFGNSAEYPCVVADNKVEMTPAVLNGALRSFSKDVVAQTVNLQLTPYIVSTLTPTSKVEVEKTFGPYALTAVPFAPESVIEQSYYLLLSTDAESWTLDGAIASKHSDTNVYDDPVFKFYYNVTADQITRGGVYWKVIPASVYNMTDWREGVWYGATFDDQSKAEGTLALSNAVPGLNITLSGDQELSINLEEMTFKYIAAIPYLYAVGAPDWSPATAPALATTDYVNYAGFAYLDSEYKYTGQRNWDPLNWGFESGDATNGTLKEKADNIKNVPAGLYWTKVDLGKLTYSNVAINSLGIIGDAVAETGWGSEVTLQSTDAKKMIWTGDVDIAAGGEFKIRANNDWADSWGGSADNLVYNAGNIKNTLPAGKYTVTVNLTVLPYAVTFTAK